MPMHEIDGDPFSAFSLLAGSLDPKTATRLGMTRCQMITGNGQNISAVTDTTPASIATLVNPCKPINKKPSKPFPD
jgi:hypothetical protein